MYLDNNKTSPLMRCKVVLYMPNPSPYVQLLLPTQENILYIKVKIYRNRIDYIVCGDGHEATNFRFVFVAKFFIWFANQVKPSLNLRWTNFFYLKKTKPTFKNL